MSSGSAEIFSIIKPLTEANLSLVAFFDKLRYNKRQFNMHPNLYDFRGNKKESVL